MLKSKEFWPPTVNILDPLNQLDGGGVANALEITTDMHLKNP